MPSSLDISRLKSAYYGVQNRRQISLANERRNIVKTLVYSTLGIILKKNCWNSHRTRQKIICCPIYTMCNSKQTPLRNQAQPETTIQINKQIFSQVFANNYIFKVICSPGYEMLNNF